MASFKSAQLYPETSKRSVLHATADEYAEGATVHGVGYIFDELLPTIDRVIWGFSVGFFFVLAVLFTTNAYTDWQDNMVITTLKNTAKDVTELVFPAVTVCSEGLNMDAVSKALARDFSEWSSEKESGSSEALHSDLANPFIRLKRQVGGPRDASSYMQEKFGISQDSEFSIFDVINAMSSSNVEKSTASDGVRKNQLACASSGGATIKSEVSNETLCIDSGGVVVNNDLCFVAGTTPKTAFDETTFCNRTNGLNTSLFTFPADYQLSFDFCKYCKVSPDLRIPPQQMSLT